MPYRMIILLTTLLLFSTSSAAVDFYTLPELHKKSGSYLPGLMESTPVVWQGEVLTVTSERAASHGTSINIHRMTDKSLVVTVPFAYGLTSSIVHNGRLYVFGSSDWGIANNAVYMMSSADLATWTAPIKVLDAPVGYRIFNTSVAPDATGFIMAYETNEATAFSIRFAHSTDFVSWQNVGNIFQPTTYAACPTVRYVDGWYFILYLRKPNAYYTTFAARTQDFVNYQYFNGNAKWPTYIQFMSAQNFPTEGINNSDVDLVEHNGSVYITYAVGDQATWHNIRTAVYFGTIKNLYNEFWN